MFHYRRGEVVVDLDGQECKRCASGICEPADWFEDEMSRVLGELVLKIRQKFYGLPRKQKSEGAYEGRRRHGSNAGIEGFAA